MQFGSGECLSLTLAVQLTIRRERLFTRCKTVHQVRGDYKSVTSNKGIMNLGDRQKLPVNLSNVAK
ncbi:MAG: hypothetical protein JWN70_6090 [Planctomycetaceae bacterium]|nr:hypothetical protein [Planctomycetaceae bacterium]